VAAFEARSVAELVTKAYSNHIASQNLAVLIGIRAEIIAGACKLKLHCYALAPCSSTLDGHWREMCALAVMKMENARDGGARKAA